MNNHRAKDVIPSQKLEDNNITQQSRLSSSIRSFHKELGGTTKLTRKHLEFVR
jgi:hypothetical protein